MSDRAVVVQTLNQGPLAGGEHLSDAGRAELLAAIDRLERAGHQVAVVVLPDGEPLAPWRSLWTDLGFEAENDLLVLYGGQRWEAKGLGLSPSAIAATLDGAEADLAGDPGRGLAVAVRSLGEAAGVGVTSVLVPVGIGAAGVALTGVLGALAWVVYRRNLRASEQGRELLAARSEVEDVVSSLVIGAEQLGEEGRELQHAAARLQDEVGRIPAGLEPHRAVGRLRQLETEAVALQSRMRQLNGG